MDTETQSHNDGEHQSQDKQGKLFHGFISQNPTGSSTLSTAATSNGKNLHSFSLTNWSLAYLFFLAT
jgi:hypothetical protein